MIFKPLKNLHRVCIGEYTRACKVALGTWLIDIYALETKILFSRVGGKGTICSSTGYKLQRVRPIHAHPLERLVFGSTNTTFIMWLNSARN